MTDSPKFGFLCTGKTPLELAVSVHCSHKMTESLRAAGYMPGACYTEILDGSAVDRVKHAGRTLEHLSRAVDLVLTVGCEGFAVGDDIPELTDAVCDKKATYFTSALCGAEPVYVGVSQRSENERTSTPANAVFVGASDFSARPLRRGKTQRGVSAAFPTMVLSDIAKEPLCERLNRILERFGGAEASSPNESGSHVTCSHITDAVALKIFSGIARRSGKPLLSDHSGSSRAASRATACSVPFPGDGDGVAAAAAAASAPQAAPSAEAEPSESCVERTPLRLPPSRAHAGIAGKALILNFSNDVATALPLLTALLPAIHFSVYNLCGKSAVTTAEFNEKLKKLADLDDFVENKRVINK